MSDIQFIVLLATIMFGSCFAAGNSDSWFGACLIAGILYGVAFYLWLT